MNGLKSASKLKANNIDPIVGNLAHAVRTYYSTLQPQELVFYRTSLATL